MSEARFRACEADRDAFLREGWLVTPRLFTEAELETARDAVLSAWRHEVDRLAGSPSVASGRLAFARQRPELQRLHTRSETLAALCLDDRLVDLAMALLGPDVDLTWNQAYPKAPSGDPRTAVPWHQDGYYAELDGPSLNCWLALTDTHVANGGLHRAPVESRTLPHRWDDVTLFYRCEVNEGRASPVELVAGQAFIFGPLVPHRSGTNRSQTPRVGYSISFAHADARLAANGESFGDGVPAARGGERVLDRLVRHAQTGAPDAFLDGALARVRARLDPHLEGFDAALDEALAAVRRGDPRARGRLVGILGASRDAPEVLGDLARARGRADQLALELGRSDAEPPSVRRALAERLLELAPGHDLARRVLASLDAHRGTK